MLAEDMNNPLVSICCICYNQEHYIKDALEGFVSQETSFPFEIVISDDCSSDSTKDIICEFIQAFPLLFRDVSPTKNLGSLSNFIHVQEEAKGKYIALCEGDDFWTDHLKLQKQIDFLENNPDYTLCFTNCLVNNNGQKSKGNVFLWDTYFTRDLLLHNSLGVKKRGDSIVPPGHTSTLVYRKPNASYPKWLQKCFIGDEPLFIWLSTFGKAKFINCVTSNYRQGIGISTSNYTFESDSIQRIRMYNHIDKGLRFKYHALIHSNIIASYFVLLAKRAYKQKKYPKTALFLLRSLLNRIQII